MSVPSIPAKAQNDELFYVDVMREAKRAGDVRAVEQFFSDALQCPFEDKRKIYGIYIRALLAERDLDQAFSIFEQAQSGGFADSTNYATAVRIMGKKNDIERVHNLHIQAKNAGVANISFLNTYIEVLFQKDKEKAQSVFQAEFLPKLLEREKSDQGEFDLHKLHYEVAGFYLMNIFGRPNLPECVNIITGKAENRKKSENIGKMRDIALNWAEGLKGWNYAVPAWNMGMVIFKRTKTDKS